MGLPRALAFLKFGNGPQVLEVFLDPLCPPSGRMLRSLASNVIPLVGKGGKYDGQLSVITRVYPQPFHYFSPFPSEALLVFGHDHPELFLDYFLAVMDAQSQFANQKVMDKTPNEVVSVYVNIALDVLEKAGKLGSGPRSAAHGQLTEQLIPRDKANGGSVAFMDYKFLIKEGRQNGIHVTPTALFNGLEEGTISSSWGKDDWDQFLASRLD